MMTMMMNVAKFFRKYKFLIESNDAAPLREMGYNIEKTIGEGTYSKVCMATFSSEKKGTEKMACKIINKKYTGVDFIKKFLPRELKIICQIEHPHIVAVHSILEIGSTIYIFMEYCRNGDLLDCIKNHGPLSVEKSRNYFRQLTSAVKYLHDLDIAHRDLKCENVLLTINGTIKLGDFGFARNCLDQFGNYVFSETFCGSAAYAAPEILQGVAYDPKMYDMWSLGCILYIMLTTSMPFDDSNIKKMLKNQLNRSICIVNLKTTKKSYHHLKTLLARLLEPDPHRRATINQVYMCTWLRSNKKCMKFTPSLSDTEMYVR